MALSREREIKQNDLVEYLDSQNVIDMKLLPDHEMQSILARIVIYPNDPEVKIETDELLSKICEYANYENLDKCLEDKWVDKIKRTKVTGQ